MTNVKNVLKEAEESKGEVKKICSELVKIPTVNPPGITKGAVEYIKSYFDAIGLRSEIHAREAGKSNLCVRLNGDRDGKILWLGHLDVVPEGDRNLWISNPFGGEFIKDRVYGRGASDMKGACASAMVAAKILNMIGSDNRCTVEFWFTCDEETGATDGVGWLSETGRLRGDVCIIGDGENHLPDNPAIDIGCQGYIRPEVIAEGVAAHGSQPFLGDNAIEKLVRVVNEVKRIEEMKLDVPKALDPAIDASIELFKRARTFSNEQVASLERLFHHPTTSLNIIKGGVKVNVVPDKAEAVLDIRIAPGADLDEVKREIIKIVESSGVKGVNVKFQSPEGDGYYEDPNSSSVKKVFKAVEVATNKSPMLKLLTGGTDAIPLKRHVNIPCIGFGVGLQGTSHVHNEYIKVDNLVMGTKVYSTIPLIYEVG